METISLWTREPRIQQSSQRQRRHEDLGWECSEETGRIWATTTNPNENYLLSLIGWFSLQKAESRLIIRWRKVQPEGTTLHACWRLPIKDSSSFCVQWRFCDQKTRIVWIRSNFSCGRRACNRRESSSMPKTVRIVEGLSNLSGWRGIPQSWNCWILVFMFRWHVWELGGPRVWKSSRLWRRNLTSYCFLRTHSTRSATEEKT